MLGERCVGPIRPAFMPPHIFNVKIKSVRAIADCGQAASPLECRLPYMNNARLNIAGGDSPLTGANALCRRPRRSAKKSKGFMCRGRPAFPSGGVNQTRRGEKIWLKKMVA